MLFEQITQDATTALKSGDKTRVATLRFLIAAIKRFEIDTYPPSKGGKLSEDDVMKIVQKQVKTHRESIEAFTKGNRPDLAEKEQKELEILQTYVPKELSDEEIRTIVQKVKDSGVTNFGQMMGMAMKEVAGRASGDRVSAVVKELTNG